MAHQGSSVSQHVIYNVQIESMRLPVLGHGQAVTPASPWQASTHCHTCLPPHVVLLCQSSVRSFGMLESAGMNSSYLAYLIKISPADQYCSCLTGTRTDWCIAALACRMIPQGATDVTVVAFTVGTAVMAAMQWLHDLRCAPFAFQD